MQLSAQNEDFFQWVIEPCRWTLNTEELIKYFFFANQSNEVYITLNECFGRKMYENEDILAKFNVPKMLKF